MNSEGFEKGFYILDKWLSLRLSGDNLESFFEDNDIKTVAIYGVGALGERLFQELQHSSVDVLYAIDRIAEHKDGGGLQIYNSNESSFPNADVIVVTPTQYYWDIVEKLENKTAISIISLEDVIEYCYRKKYKR